MPIRPDLLHLYTAPAWKAVRERVFTRANNRCEKCGAKQGTKYFSSRTGNLVVVQLGVAHLDHEDLERFYDEANLMCVDRACHLKIDAELHSKHARETRQRSKDQKRPLFGEAA